MYIIIVSNNYNYVIGPFHIAYINQYFSSQYFISSLATMGTSFKWIGMIRATRVEQPAAEAKKAEGASLAALLMPSPPRLTGRVTTPASK